MFKSFIMEFIKNPTTQKGTILCLLFEIVKSGSITHSITLLALVFFVYFALCYIILFGKYNSPEKKKRRISDQYRPIKPIL